MTSFRSGDALVGFVQAVPQQAGSSFFRRLLFDGSGPRVAGNQILQILRHNQDFKDADAAPKAGIGAEVASPTIVKLPVADLHLMFNNG